MFINSRIFNITVN